MKFKSSLLTLALTATLALVAGCGEKDTGEKLQGDVELYRMNNTKVISTYRSLRLNGSGYDAEDFTLTQYEDGSRFEVNNVKALVVAVDFTDYPASSLPKGEEGTLQDINNAIFGESEDTGWESLQSYYRKSSFGKCNITGTLAPVWFHTGVSVKEFANNTGTTKYGSSTGATQGLCGVVRDWAKTELGLDMRDYDANGDGYIDSVIMIYSAPFHVKVNNKAVDDDLFWAFCWSAGGAKSNTKDPGYYRFFWASIRTFYEDGYYDANGKHKDWTDAQIANGEALLDAHTLIHEFGHVMSLPDLYNGDYSSSDRYAYDAVGGVDMMSYNVGDQNSWSKALYGWVDPYVVHGNGQITLNSTTDTGEFIIVPIEGKWDSSNATLLSQYLLIEFVTPTGVAYSDSLDAYAGSYPMWFNQPGVRVFHVDARPGMFASGGKFQGFTASVSRGNGYYVTFANSNVHIDDSSFKQYKIIELVSSTGVARVDATSEIAKNADLFHEGDSFNLKGSTWQNFMLNGKDGTKDTKLGIGFKIVRMDGGNSVTIKFSTVK